MIEFVMISDKEIYVFGSVALFASLLATLLTKL